MKLLRTKECIIFEKFFPDEYNAFGCGPGGIGDWFVPDTMWGLSVREACKQHDYDYRFSRGASNEHRKQCDNRMRDNMRIIVNAKSDSKILKAMRHVRINTYYWFVRSCGSGSYWKERN